MTVDTLYLVHWKPESGLPVVQAHFSTPGDAVAHMQRLVAGRTSSGDWAVVTVASAWGADQRDVLLRRVDGVVESYFISEHPAYQASGRGSAQAPSQTWSRSWTRTSTATVPTSLGPQWEDRYRPREA